MCLSFPQNPWGVGFLFSFFFFRGEAFTKKRYRGPQKPFSEEDVSTASCRRAVDGDGMGRVGSSGCRAFAGGCGWDGDGWGALGVERLREDVAVDGVSGHRAFAGGCGHERRRVGSWVRSVRERTRTGMGGELCGELWVPGVRAWTGTGGTRLGANVHLYNGISTASQRPVKKEECCARRPVQSRSDRVFFSKIAA